MAKLFVNMSTILGQHAILSLKKWPNRRWTHTPVQILHRLRELGITPEKPDEEIMAALEELVDSAEMVEPEDHVHRGERPPA